MPRPDPIPSPRRSLIRQFWRIMRLMALFAIIIAAIAVVLVIRGEGDAVRTHMIVATALMAGGSVLVAGALMSLLFLSSRSGHDEQARRVDKEKEL